LFRFFTKLSWHPPTGVNQEEEEIEEPQDCLRDQQGVTESGVLFLRESQVKLNLNNCHKKAVDWSSKIENYYERVKNEPLE
jgi:hypothetical protein